MIRLAKRSLAIALLSFVGCGNGKTPRDSGIDSFVAGSDSSCVAGTLGCRCDLNQSCSNNLVCASQICVDPGGMGGPAALLP